MIFAIKVIYVNKQLYLLARNIKYCITIKHSLVLNFTKSKLFNTFKFYHKTPTENLLLGTHFVNQVDIIIMKQQQFILCIFYTTYQFYCFQDNSEEMYSLDNDSFLNSLEAMTIQNYWTDTVKHTKLQYRVQINFILWYIIDL